MFVSFKGAGKRFSYKIGGELGCIWGRIRWKAGSGSEIVDQLEDKELRKCAAQI